MIGIILLSIIQGITEFLPISSSAHLIIAREVFRIGTTITTDMALTFDLAVHLGTLIAVVAYFFKDLLKILISGILKGIKDNDGKIFWLIIIATIPAALAGIFGEEIIEKAIRGNLYIIASALALMGIIIYLVDQKYKTDKTINQLNFKNALLIGFFQIFALIPGFSRSGTTITAGRILNLNREESAKFSFYLSIPIIFGAILYKSINKETLSIISNDLNIFIFSILISAIVGMLAIGFLLNYLKKHDFKIFMWYRLGLALIVFIFLIIK